MTTAISLDDQLGRNAAPEQVSRIFKELRELKVACRRADAHSRVIVLIQACIDNGINTRSRIRGTLNKLGFNEDHVVIVLNACAGPNPDVYHWYRDEAGVYHNHVGAPVPIAA
ncbi:hypothetical protein [Novosphingobium sp.]|uniref:hypothetical protein n=1 Tax=Novosphingobium sp. TaxID=1874826 RepID=UPI0026109C5A|nr:hypothetical protein [Novosphingobium sp.]